MENVEWEMDENHFLNFTGATFALATLTCDQACFLFWKEGKKNTPDTFI